MSFEMGREHVCGTVPEAGREAGVLLSWFQWVVHKCKTFLTVLSGPVCSKKYMKPQVADKSVQGTASTTVFNSLLVLCELDFYM